ncbi:hypothetical protein cand_032290 [Cryptosporidium andersoni]|uniref:Uncharacterized protein n=1 Tax=Cryptosporidium andersoni TaxID=117008 RepID=A0A1J4MER6_9CRYT|nr:hypothetical protein cand_032290 [Cryptosporidium andersoni]
MSPFLKSVEDIGRNLRSQRWADIVDDENCFNNDSNANFTHYKRDLNKYELPEYLKDEESLTETEVYDFLPPVKSTGGFKKKLKDADEENLDEILQELSIDHYISISEAVDTNEKSRNRVLKENTNQRTASSSSGCTARALHETQNRNKKQKRKKNTSRPHF